jgi:hypothetical protein
MTLKKGTAYIYLNFMTFCIRSRAGPRWMIDGLSQAAAEAPVDHLVDTGLYAAAVPCVKGPPTAYARPDGPSMCSARTGAGGT